MFFKIQKNALKQQAQALLKNHGINSHTLKHDGNISSSTLKRLETRGDAPMLRRKSETHLTSPSRELKRPALSTSALHSTLPSVSASANNISQADPVVTEQDELQTVQEKQQTEQTQKDGDKQAISRTTSDSSMLKKSKTNSTSYPKLVPKTPSSNPSNDLKEMAKKKPKTHKKRTKGSKQKGEAAIQEVEKVKEKQTEEKADHDEEKESIVKPPRPDGGLLGGISDSGAQPTVNGSGESTDSQTSKEVSIEAVHTIVLAQLLSV